MGLSPNKNQRRVVVTGLGVVSSLGIGWQDFWKNLLAGKSGVSEVDYFDTTPYDRKYAGQVKNFHPEDFISKAKLKYMGRASQMAVAASKMALADAGLKKKDIDPYRTGVCIGTTMGEPGVLEVMNRLYAGQKKEKIKKPMVPNYPANLISENVAHEFFARGMNLLFANACAAGNFATGYAIDQIRFNRADLMIVGGADAFSKVAFTGFHRLISMAEKKCMPFDENRDGIILGEGAGIFILEEFERAQTRGANVYAEVVGFGAASDAHHMTQPNPRGGIKAITKALTDAGIQPEDVDYISAHGTATPENDKAECAVFYQVFGKKIKNIPVSSIKSMLGHTLGASSALESVACCLTIEDGKIPPTINYETPDPECDIDCVPNTFREHPVRIALNNSLAFGGHDFCIVLRQMK